MNNNLVQRKSLDEEWLAMNAALAKIGHSAKAKPLPLRRSGRLIVALDLTGSREASLRQARVATAAMFKAIRDIGAVAVRLVYYRGLKECRASKWHADPGTLIGEMEKLTCEFGGTQIARVLRLALAEKEKLSGVVFVGDHCEEYAQELMGLARDLGQRSIPLFVFHECADHDKPSLEVKPLFRHMAEASGGVYSEFKPDSGAVLRELLSTVAAFSVAGSDGVNQMTPPETSEARQLRGKLRLMLNSGGAEKGSK